LRYADLSHADLSHAKLHHADLSRADLRYANLSYADLHCADLRYADLSDTKLCSADLSYAYLRHAKLHRADLSRADLSYADLSRANLSCADLLATGNMVNVKSLQADIWRVAYTHDILQIGCQRHPIGEWWAFDDKKIECMDSRALAWWAVWKPILQAMIAASPAEPTGFRLPA
jgi:aspartate 1-decarboxylase